MGRDTIKPEYFCKSNLINFVFGYGLVQGSTDFLRDRGPQVNIENYGRTGYNRLYRNYINNKWH